IAVAIQRHAVRPASNSSYDFDNLAIFHDTDGFGIDVANVERIVESDIHCTARLGYEVGPLLQEFACLIENLNATVFCIGHDHMALRIDHDCMGQIKLTRLGTLSSSNDPDKFSFL